MLKNHLIVFIFGCFLKIILLNFIKYHINLSCITAVQVSEFWAVQAFELIFFIFKVTIAKFCKPLIKNWLNYITILLKMPVFFTKETLLRICLRGDSTLSIFMSNIPTTKAYFLIATTFKMISHTINTLEWITFLNTLVLHMSLFATLIAYLSFFIIKISVLVHKLSEIDLVLLAVLRLIFIRFFNALLFLFFLQFWDLLLQI